jgi:hypothetical protein
VIASVSALGYHERIADKPDVPNFLVELRRSAFARIYNSDKSFAIFLGRPPRISKRTVSLQLPSCHSDWDSEAATTADLSPATGWDVGVAMSYRAEARWSGMCMSIMEEILEILMGEDRSGANSRVKYA